MSDHDSSTYITLPRYFMFTIARDATVKRSVEFIEKIDLREYTKESANVEMKYTLCAVLVFTCAKTYFPIVKYNQENKWLIFDKKNVYECSKDEVVQHVEDSAVLLVYSRHGENGSAGAIIKNNQIDTQIKVENSH